MSQPQVKIEVNDKTGRWSVDSLPMILVPQHFFLNHHFAVEAELGASRLEAVLRPAGYESARHWCEKEAAHHGLVGAEVFHHYMKRISQRGWGQFAVLELDLDAGAARVQLKHSAFVDDERRGSGRCVCYRFASWLEGSLDYVSEATGRTHRFEAREVYCEAQGARDHCLFEAKSKG